MQNEGWNTVAGLAGGQWKMIIEAAKQERKKRASGDTSARVMVNQVGLGAK